MPPAHAPGGRAAAGDGAVNGDLTARMGWAGVAKEAARGLTAVRGRSALALVGIVVGIGSVIAMVSTGEIVREQAMKQFEALGTDIVTARTYYVPRLRRVVTFPLDAIMAIDAEVAEIETAAGWNETNARLSHRGRDIEGAGMLGVTGSFADVANLEVAEGRFVSDLDARQRYCVVGAGIARGDARRRRYAGARAAGQARGPALERHRGAGALGGEPVQLRAGQVRLHPGARRRAVHRPGRGGRRDRTGAAGGGDGGRRAGDARVPPGKRRWDRGQGEDGRAAHRRHAPPGAAVHGAARGGGRNRARRRGGWAS